MMETVPARRKRNERKVWPDSLPMTIIGDGFGRTGPAKSRNRGGVRMLNVGDKAPDFEVLDQEGNTVRLSNYEGKTVVLWFYPRASTGG